MIAIPRLVVSGIDRDCLGVNVTVDVQVYNGKICEIAHRVNDVDDFWLKFVFRVTKKDKMYTWLTGAAESGNIIINCTCRRVLGDTTRCFIRVYV